MGMPEPELSENDITIKKGKDIVIEPGLSIYRIGGAILIATPSDWGWDDEEALPHIEVFPLEGEHRKHELERMVNVLDGILWIMGPAYSKHEKHNISIGIEEQET